MSEGSSRSQGGSRTAATATQSTWKGLSCTTRQTRCACALASALEAAHQKRVAIGFGSSKEGHVAGVHATWPNCASRSAICLSASPITFTHPAHPTDTLGDAGHDSSPCTGPATSNSCCDGTGSLLEPQPPDGKSHLHTTMRPSPVAAADVHIEATERYRWEWDGREKSIVFCLPGHFCEAMFNSSGRPPFANEGKGARQWARQLTNHIHLRETCGRPPHSHP